MLLLSHAIIALLSLISSTLAMVSPSRNKLRASYLAAMATIASGTYLVIATHSSLTQACLAGLVYTGFTLACIIVARRRLAHAADTVDE